MLGRTWGGRGALCTYSCHDTQALTFSYDSKRKSCPSGSAGSPAVLTNHSFEVLADCSLSKRLLILIRHRAELSQHSSQVYSRQRRDHTGVELVQELEQHRAA